MSEPQTRDQVAMDDLHLMLMQQATARLAEIHRLTEQMAKAVADERAACAALCEMVGAKKEGHSIGYRAAAWEIAELIRGRGANRA